MSATNTVLLPVPADRLRRRLLAWYDCHRRDLPWRARPRERADPYRVWLSEIMLQQTTVAAVCPYFTAFMARWPTVRELAAADLDAVLVAWQGLGYYARARNLHACARQVAASADGRFPDTEAALRQLPGVGAYTAAAIAAIAFDRPTVPVDGNALRVLSRLAAVATPLPDARHSIEDLARQLTPPRRAGDLAQALMDLGATLCTPRRPRCDACPWAADCRAFGQGRPEAYPVKAPKAVRPLRRGVAFWTRRGDGAVLLRRRPPQGLLGGMMEIPSTEWRATAWTAAEAARSAPLAAHWRPLAGMVTHVFTHFRLELEILSGAASGRAPAGALWCRIADLDGQALPTVMRKVIRHALQADGDAP